MSGCYLWSWYARDAVVEFFFVGICWCACGQGERKEDIINLTCSETATVAV